MGKGRNAAAALSKRDREERQAMVNAMAKAIRAGKTDRELSEAYDLGEVRALRRAMAEHDRRRAEAEGLQPGLFDESP